MSGSRRTSRRWLSLSNLLSAALFDSVTLQRVAIVAGEASGDALGAEVVAAIKARHPHVEFVGLAGPLMQAQGVTSLAEMDKISIMGMDGLWSSLREILAIRSHLYHRFVDWKPDVFIGIDVPDFNLGLEIKLRRHGIPVAHCVSPTVWAWRGGRIRKIKRAVDVMLALFPFEVDYYRRHQAPVLGVGHPLARQVLDWHPSPEFVQRWPVSDKRRRIALLPGSRMSEVSRLAPTMLAAARVLQERYPDLEWILPAAKPKLAQAIRDLPEFDPSVVTLIDGFSRDVLNSCHLAVLASGTAALEAALFAKPMLVLYKVSRLTEWYAGRSMQVTHYSMPNHLTSPPAVTEYVQNEVTVDNVVSEVARLLEDADYYQTMHSALSAIAPTLNRPTGELVATALEELARDPNFFKKQVTE